MKNLIATLAVALFVVAASLGFVSSVNASTFGPLIGAEQLASALKKKSPIILDIRNSGYEEGHLKDAVSAPYSLFRGPKTNPGQLVDVTKLEADLEKIGLSTLRPIVIVSQGNSTTDFGAAARVYWTLKSTGYKDLSILNGGIEAWTAAKQPLTKDVPVLRPVDLSLTFNKTWLAETADVSNVVSGKSKAILVDSRFQAFYEGKKAHPAAKEAGTLPGAVNHAYANFFTGENKTINTKVDLASLKKALGVKGEEPVVSFCNTGHWAATHWFATSELAGLPNAKLYPGSMVEYASKDLPMDNVPSWLDKLLRQFQ